MENAIYATISRQAGLTKELDIVAQNIANMASTGYKAEGMVFSEHLRALDGQEALSMARGNARKTDFAQGALSQTRGTLDFAIEGQGFFLIQSGEQQLLTRNGAFHSDTEGQIVTADGAQLLDNGGAAIALPSGAAQISLGADGVLSADGRQIARVGVYQPTSPENLTRHQGSSFTFSGELEPVEDAQTVQGFLESSNVDPVAQIARMIEVQRAYEMGQGLMEREDERIRDALRTLGQ
ncbi:MAG: flagellar hook-basal body complex protein [Pseudomonadota bacterium]|nr:flagellar hook-basal body complex protein [Pseudomonadota bacterium]MEC8794999.1 flagellar hook-basal body complex protein [Pseudomonadota bacterium]